MHNNAGINIAGPVEFLQLSDYQKVLDVNILGMIDITTTFLPLVKKEKGRIVNTASMAGRLSLPGMSPYNMSKYAVEAFSDSLRHVIPPLHCYIQYLMSHIVA